MTTQSSAEPPRVRAVDELVAAQCLAVVRERFGPAVHAGVTVRRGPHYLQVASSDPPTARCDTVETDEQEGPCLDAMDTLAGVLVPRISTQRWPAWSAAALDAGYVSAAALPAWVDEGTAVALNLYSEVPDPWDRDRLLAMDATVHALARRLRDGWA